MQQHEIDNLLAIIKLQKRKGKKNKRLDLARDPAGLPVCYSPAKVERALQYQEEKEAQEIEERRQVDARKAQRAINAAINKEKKDTKAAAA